MPLRGRAVPWGLLMPCVVAGWIAAISPAEAAVRPGVLLGAGLHIPTGDPSDVYGAAFTPRLGGCLRIGDRPYELSLEAGYAKSTSRSITGSILAANAEGTLERIGIDLTLRVPLAHGAVRPYLGAGAEALLLRERFTYDLLGEPRSRTPDWRTAPGFLVLAGVERSTAPHIAIEGVWSAATVERRIDQGRFLEDADAGDVAMNSFEARILWRLP